MKSIIKCIIAMFMPLAFIACSSDDEPEQNQLTAQEEYNNLLNIVCDSEGNIVFLPCNEDGSERGMEVLDEKESTAFCRVLLNFSWNGKKATRTLPEGYGTITVTPSNESGVFHTVSFNLKGIEPFTLKLATAEYFSNDNMAIVNPGAMAQNTGDANHADICRHTANLCRIPVRYVRRTNGKPIPPAWDIFGDNYLIQPIAGAFKYLIQTIITGDIFVGQEYTGCRINSIKNLKTKEPVLL